MGALKKIQDFILPQEIDFFGKMIEQSRLTKEILDLFYAHYVAHSQASVMPLVEKIHGYKDIRRNNLQELYQVFITPLDKEAISRAYMNLDWVVKSIKHLEVELEAYQITDLASYKSILDIVKTSMDEVHKALETLSQKDYAKFTSTVFNIVHLDNLAIKEYAKAVTTLLISDDFKYVFKHKDVLNQIKEISHRIRICANDLEDMIFKMS